MLHLPLRYIDETRITAIRDLRAGDSAQVEGEIVHTEVQYKPRKALISQLRDASGQLTLRFLHFYPSQIKALAAGKRLRVLGEVRNGFFGWEMVHPQCRPVGVDTPVATSLTPVYPTTAGLSQAAIRKRLYKVNLKLTVANQRGMLAKIAAGIADAGSNIDNVSMEEPDGSAYTNMHFTVQVRDRVHLADLMRRLRRIPDLVRINRVKGSGSDQRTQ